MFGIDRFYPSAKTCSVCGFVFKELELREWWWGYAECGTVLDHDRNASMNILSVGASTIGLGDIRQSLAAIAVRPQNPRHSWREVHQGNASMAVGYMATPSMIDNERNDYGRNKLFRCLLLPGKACAHAPRST